MYPKLSIFRPTIFLIFGLLFGFGIRPTIAADAPKPAANTYLIQEIKSNQQGDALSVEIVGNNPPVYTMYELFNPARVILDIANANLDKKITPNILIPDNNLAKLTAKSLTDQNPPLTRFELTIKESHTYTVDRDKNNLLILVHPKTESGQVAKPTNNKEEAAQTDAAFASSTQKEKKGTQVPTPKDNNPPADPTLDKLIDSSSTAMSKGKAKEQSEASNATDSQANSFDFGGYKGAKRISVDFYKIDLHNVFRLFREISGINIIVDEAVKGSLTLALNDVPWDFALDIILNLKDLRKEERFNTIVIYPAEKAFIWPERAQDNLTVEADLEIVQQEKDALVIEQSAAQSEEITQSKEFIRKGLIEEKADNMEKAAANYEQALKLDPKNSKLANRLAAIYLVNLGMNAKAVHCAKESLKIQPKNTQAALYAAIGLANMNQIPEATNYFAQSISEPTPMKEALISYASFSEQNGQLDNALKLLTRYNSLYGESVDTMVAKARIYDNMGQSNKANDQYKALLTSGYPLAPSLKEYIQGRLGANSGSGI